MARLTAALVTLALLFLQAAPPARAADWNAILEQARGQTVFWNAWGGDERINAYITWVGSRVAEDHGVTLRHVKLTDTAEAVSRVLAEKTAGRAEGGTIDLIWINGENFAAMKAQGLLHGPFVEDLPNHALVDFVGKPTTLVDFTVPTDGLEAPWGMAKFNFVYDSARIQAPPQNAAALAVWSAINRGRFTYPAPPDFLGSTFLKQALIELAEDPAVLQAEVPDEATFRAVTTPLWRYLETLHPFMWRDGESFPASGPAQRQLLNDGEIDIALSFHPSETSSLIADGQLPESARVFVFPEGTIGNTHFVAIPYNASNVEGAMVVANFLLSPEAQARKQSSEVWGDDTVLDLAKLTPDQRRLFDALPKGPATLPPDALGPVLPEPHPSWMTKIEAEWLARYSR
ncbi:MAG: ABC transporter substrate-binding protein [Kiloniellales bacterium]|nr:ABC transporter substrate-binding protein [Kiloniellales bacterium]